MVFTRVEEDKILKNALFLERRSFKQQYLIRKNNVKQIHFTQYGFLMDLHNPYEHSDSLSSIVGTPLSLTSVPFLYKRGKTDAEIIEQEFQDYFEYQEKIAEEIKEFEDYCNNIKPINFGYNEELRSWASSSAEIDEKGMITIIESPEPGIYQAKQYGSEYILRRKIPLAENLSLPTEFFRKKHGFGINFYDAEWEFLFSVPIKDKLFDHIKHKLMMKLMEKIKEKELNKKNE